MKPLDRQPPLMRALEDPPSHSRLFAQVPFDLVRDRQQPAEALALYCHLDALVVEHGKDAWSTSAREIARDLDMPKSTAIRAIAWLVEQDYLRRAPSEYRYQTTFVVVQRIDLSTLGVVTSDASTLGVVTTDPRGGHSKDRTSSYRKIDQRENDLINTRARSALFLSTPEQVEERMASWGR